MKKTFVRVLLTFIVSSTLILIPATSAQALDIGALLKAGAKGATIGGPVAMGVTKSNPVGWLWSAGTIAFGVWEARDLWLEIKKPPEVKTLKDFAGKDPTWTDPAVEDPAGWGAQGADAAVEVKITILSDTAPNTLRVETNCLHVKFGGFGAGQTSCGYLAASNPYGSDGSVTHARADLPGLTKTECVSSGGAVTAGNTAGAVLFPVVTGQAGLEHPSFHIVKTYALCPAGTSIQGVQIAPRKSMVSSTTYQQFGLAAGALTGTKVLPEGDVQFDRFNTDVECTNNITGEVQHLTAFTDGGDGAVIPSCKGRLGSDWRTTGVTIAPAKPKVDGVPVAPEVDVPDFLPPEWDELIPEEFQQTCVTDPDGCALDIFIDGKRCNDGNSECVDWKKTRLKERDRVKCIWGVKVVAIEKCGSLATYYQPNTDTTVDQTTNPLPPVGDPWVDTVPETKPKPPREIGDEPKQSKCFPSGWGVFNPFEWVYKPVECVLTWAFVPHPAEWGWAGLVEQAETRPPVSIGVGIASAASALASAYQGSGDCGILADFRSSDMPNAAITCAQVKSFPGFGGLYALVQAGLFALTGLGLWKMFSGVLEDGQ